MHRHKGKITTYTINAVEIVRKELEEISAEVTVAQPFKIDLRWGDNKPAEDYYGDQDSQGSLLSKPTGGSEFKGIIYTRSGEDKEDWHHPQGKEINKNFRPEIGLGTLNVPVLKIKESGVMKEKYGEHGQNPQPVNVVKSGGFGSHVGFRYLGCTVAHNSPLQ